MGRRLRTPSRHVALLTLWLVGVGAGGFVCAPVAAQEGPSLTGTVRDSTGAPLPGVLVTLAPIPAAASAAPRTIRTGTTGEYGFPSLSPGRYIVTVALSGFRNERRDVDVSASPIQLDFTLQADTSSDAITISGASAAVSISPHRNPVTLRGTVTDSLRMEPVPDITVKIQPHERFGGPASFAVTDRTGAFKVDVPDGTEWQLLDVTLVDHHLYRTRVVQRQLSRDEAGLLAYRIEPLRSVARAQLPAVLEDLDEVGKRGGDPWALRAGLEAVRALYPSEFAAGSVLAARAAGLAQDFETLAFQRSFIENVFLANGISVDRGFTGGRNVFLEDPLRVPPGLNAANASLIFGTRRSDVLDELPLASSVRMTATQPGSAPPMPTAVADRLSASAVSPLVTASPMPGAAQSGAPRPFDTWSVVPAQWRTMASYAVTQPRWTAGSMSLPCRCPAIETAFGNLRIDDLTVSTGGRLRSDRLWLSGDYGYRSDREAQPGSEIQFPRESTVHDGGIRLTWQTSPVFRVRHAYRGNLWTAGEAPTAGEPFATLVTYRGWTAAVDLADIGYVPSDATMWETRASLSLVPLVDVRPNNGGGAAPWRYDLSSGVSSGGSYEFGRHRQVSALVASTITHFRSARGQQHTFSVTPAVNLASEQLMTGLGGNINALDDGGPLLALMRLPSSAAVGWRSISVSGRDRLQLGSRVSIDTRVRYAHSEAQSPDARAIDDRGRDIGGAIPGLGRLYGWNLWEPAVATRVDVAGDGRVSLRAQWQRSHQGIPLVEIAAVHPGNAPLTVAFFDNAVGGYSIIASKIDAVRNVAVDPDTAAPPVDETQVELAWYPSTTLSVGVAYSRRTARRLIGWTDVAGQYEPFPAILPDGRILPALALRSDGTARKFLLGNLDERRAQYDGLTLSAKRRWAGEWDLSGTYTLSRHVGLTSASGRIAGPRALTFEHSFGFGRDPNDTINADGPLPDDRRHEFRLEGHARLPRVDIEVAGSTYYLSGTPYSSFAYVSLPQGVLPVLAAEPGTYRLPPVAAVDLLVAKSFSVRSQRFHIQLNVFNILNRVTEVDIVTGNEFSPSFAEGSRFTLPRRAQLGARFFF